MNKLFAKIIAIALALTVIFSFTACSEVENGSKIERVKITLSLADSDGETTTYEVEAKLYVNFAPETIKHIKALIEKGHYNNVDITNVTNTYFQFGDYTFDGSALTAIDGGVSAVKGEFEKNGLTGNRLTVSQGAIILKRASEGIDGVSKYNTGKATLAVALSSSAPFSVKDYCVFGKIVSDDGDKEADSSSMEYLSSLDKVLKVKETIEDANGRKIYFCLNDDTDLADSTEEEPLYNWEGQYFTYAEYEDEFHYFKGILGSNELSEDKMLSEEEARDLASKISSEANFMNIPALTAKIVKIELVK